MAYTKPIKLPRYNDDEVRAFHPVLEYALNIALQELNLDESYIVVHHDDSRALIPDYVIKNKVTGKYILFIEVKRNPGDVSSTRYRNQAKTYVTEANLTIEKPYYAVTNLEIIDLFKYTSDQSRSAVIQQLVVPSPLVVGSLYKDNVNEFLQALIDNIKIIIDISVKDRGEYQALSGKLSHLLEGRKTNLAEWHKTMVVAGFEYIRGALKDVRPLNWREAQIYQNNPQRLVDTGKSLDFNDLFTTPLPSNNDQELWDRDFLKDLNLSGRSRRSGDEIAEMAHYVITKGREHDGLVTSDPELSRLMSVISSVVLNRELNETDLICDPACGIGSLLTSLPIGFEKIKPKQIWANDKESLFLEPLSVRIGLAFPSVIATDNAPKITIKNILDFDVKDFSDITIIHMNPPYISGIYSSNEKQKFATKIVKLSGQPAKLHIGQIGLEALFVELVTELVKDGTVMSIILPEQYLVSKGPEAKAFRDFLLNNFGLQQIIIYPREGVFESVVKSTAILVGQKGQLSPKVGLTEIKLPLDQIDFTELKDGLIRYRNAEQEENIAYGCYLNNINRELLAADVENGWKSITNIGKLVNDWIIKELTPKCKMLGSLPYEINRGKLGNQGASNLIFINSNNILWNSVKKLLVESSLCLAMRTSDEVAVPFLSKATANTRILCPSLKSISGNNKVLSTILAIYLKLESHSVSKQTKKEKSISDLHKIMKTTIKSITKPNTVLIPRAIRRHARGFIATEKMGTSTNLFEVYSSNLTNQKLLLAWILSVFAQLNFEFLAKNQEGARKLEREEISQLYVPCFENILDEDKEKIILALEETKSFNDLCNIRITELDKIWAEILWGESSIEILQSAKDLLQDIVQERSPNNV